MHRMNEHPPDPVSELLRGVKVHSTVYCLSDLRAPWGFHVEDSTVAKFHLVLDGSCVLALDSAEQVELGCGDLVLLPTGTGHAVRDRPGSRIRDLDLILTDHPVDADARLVYGGRGRRTRLVCGGFQLAEALPQSLLAMLPPVVSLDRRAGGLDRWLQPLFELLRDEADDGQPGAGAVFTKLADVFLAQTLRSYLLGARDAGLIQLEPLQDPPITQAVHMLCSRPSEQWTVADLARAVGMSRTLFSARFRTLVGQTPIRYLAKVRLSRAAGYLATTNSSLSTIARRTGYDSESSLSKAFKREYGRSPGDYRRHSSAQPIVIADDDREAGQRSTSTRGPFAPAVSA
jgi:AraC-like DNA-binding protein/mannose-6-phosphate isomerase-like protein (cupin superfamily)